MKFAPGEIPDYLPESIKEMIEVIGLPATQVIVSERGGIHLNVPDQVTREHWLYEAIGKEAFAALVQYYPTNEIYIPRCLVAMIRAKEDQLIQLKEQGIKTVTLARQFKMTEAGIRLALRRARARKPEAENQQDFFTD